MPSGPFFKQMIIHFEPTLNRYTELRFAAMDFRRNDDKPKDSKMDPVDRDRLHEATREAVPVEWP